MIDSIRREIYLSTIRLPRRGNPARRVAKDRLTPLLEGLARASYGYSAALGSENPRWEAAAYKEFLAAQDMINGVLAEAGVNGALVRGRRRQ
jgi:hypothetical protein